eukprot:CAMPEP_0115714364 /NCGR_PEP_ID=MMETSP0272-20121206/75194_1 /TAXON_ID=71861 /ORGANISM="Scrippsiella trochoidea, Strain CCMP3099" /LENGTH=71 /DNA_ID=CAMNT_0003156493 /DNA_START=89 /DNA_END=300 /DNA_ORIENTATION=+
MAVQDDPSHEVADADARQLAHGRKPHGIRDVHARWEKTPSALLELRVDGTEGEPERRADDVKRHDSPRERR